MSELPAASKATAVLLTLLFADLVETCSTWTENVGYRCEDFVFAIRNDTFITPMECTLQCMQRPGCVQVDYSHVANQCLLYSSHCALLQPDEEFTSVRYKDECISRDECIRWIPFNGTIPTGRVIISTPDGVASQLLARGEVNLAVIPGKLNINSHVLWSVFNYSPQRITNDITYLDIHPSCTGVWIPYVSGSGIEIPGGAVQGGSLTDGHPVYIAKIGSPRLHFGYYDPEDGNAVYANNGNKIIKTEMDILVLLWLSWLISYKMYC